MTSRAIPASQSPNPELILMMNICMANNRPSCRAPVTSCRASTKSVSIAENMTWHMT